jgi:hypothetical protein
MCLSRDKVQKRKRSLAPGLVAVKCALWSKTFVFHKLSQKEKEAQRCVPTKHPTTTFVSVWFLALRSVFSLFKSTHQGLVSWTSSVSCSCFHLAAAQIGSRQNGGWGRNFFLDTFQVFEEKKGREVQCHGNRSEEKRKVREQFFSLSIAHCSTSSWNGKLVSFSLFDVKCPASVTTRIGSSLFFFSSSHSNV